MPYSFTLWGMLLAIQLLLAIFLPCHGPGNIAVGAAFLYVFASFPRALFPRSVVLGYLGRASFLGFAGVFGWEIVAPFFHDYGSPGSAVLMTAYIGFFTAPCWLLHWRLPPARTASAKRPSEEDCF